jgi:RNA polymerase sigma-70 factor (ECF subfamily)
MKSIDDSNDVMQIGFLKIFDNLEKYQPTGNFESWLKRIIINTSIEQLRKKRNFIDIEEMSGIETPRVQNEAIETLTANQIIDLVNHLPIGYRTVFNMFCIDGYSHKEIASQLEITESTSKSQLFKARKILQKWIREIF